MTDEKKPIFLERQDHELVPFDMPEPTQPFVLSAEICEKIDHWNLRYPAAHKRSGVFEALRLVQEANGGFLTAATMDAVADYLSISKIAVYEVAAFYTMYYLNPVGQHVINVCTNVSCALNGADHLLEHLKYRLRIGLNETTKDGKFTLKEVECLGACIAPPVCLIDQTYYERVTPEIIDEWLALKGGAHHE